MIQCILTGSHAYGKPSSKSDIDLVMLLTPTELALFKKVADENSEYETLVIDQEAALKFGNLNIIAVTDPVAFAVWQKGTAELRQKWPHHKRTRDEAVRLLDRLRRKHGVRPSEREDEEDDDSEEETEYEDEVEDEDSPIWKIGDFVKYKFSGDWCYGWIEKVFDRHDGSYARVSNRHGRHNKGVSFTQLHEATKKEVLGLGEK